MLKLFKNEQNIIQNYKILYNVFYNSLCVFAYKYLNDLDMSKDVVQEVFIKLWDKQIIFQDQTKVKAYLYKAVRNKSLDFIKDKHFQIKSNLSLDDIEKMHSDSYFYKEVVIEEASIIIDKAIGTLPNKCKKIIQLSLKGLKNSQISEELEISINTVKAQKRIAYIKLRPLLKEYYILIAAVFIN